MPPPQYPLLIFGPGTKRSCPLSPLQDLLLVADGADRAARGIRDWVVGGDIMPEFVGSDHCPAWVDLELPDGPPGAAVASQSAASAGGALAGALSRVSARALLGLSATGEAKSGPLSHLSLLPHDETDLIANVEMPFISSCSAKQASIVDFFCKPPAACGNVPETSQPLPGSKTEGESGDAAAHASSCSEEDLAARAAPTSPQEGAVRRCESSSGGPLPPPPLGEAPRSSSQPTAAAASSAPTAAAGGSGAPGVTKRSISAGRVRGGQQTLHAFLPPRQAASQPEAARQQPPPEDRSSAPSSSVPLVAAGACRSADAAAVGLSRSSQGPSDSVPLSAAAQDSQEGLSSDALSDKPVSSAASLTRPAAAAVSDPNPPQSSRASSIFGGARGGAQRGGIPRCRHGEEAVARRVKKDGPNKCDGAGFRSRPALNRLLIMDVSAHLIVSAPPQGPRVLLLREGGRGGPQRPMRFL